MARSGLILFALSLVFAAAFHSAARAQQAPSPAPSMAAGPSTAGTAPLAPAPSTETALAPGPGTGSDCMTVLIDNLSTCLTYVEAGSNLTRPEKGCCQGFAEVVNTRPSCLCSLLSSKDVYGIQIDHTKSLMLPTICRVKTPPVSLCSLITGAPVSSPEGSPLGAAPGGLTPPMAAGPSAVPPTGGGAHTGFRSSALALLAGLFFATAAIF